MGAVFGAGGGDEVRRSRVPRPAPAQARAGGRPACLGGPPPAGRSRGERRRARAGGVRLAQLERDRQRRGRLPGRGTREHARHDHDRGCRCRTRCSSGRSGRRRASRSSSPGRRSGSTTRRSCSSSTSTAVATARAARRSRASRSGSCSVAAIDYAWSATSAGSDLVDQYVETLCGGSDTMYLYRGECRRMTTFDAGTIVGRPGEPDQPLVYPETVHGPVQGYATVDGKRVAISVKRSTRGRELGSLGFFLDMSMNRVHSARDFVRAASTMELTFNWVYADSRSIAQFTSGRLPVRPATVDPGLPTKGTGEYEWQGFLPASAHAQTINPASGVILNWNNKPARGLRGRRRRVDVGPGAARRPALGRHPAAAEAHARERRRRDERRRDPGPAAHARLAGRSATCSRGEPARRARRRRPRSSMPGSHPAAAGSTPTSTARSTRRAPRSWTRRGARSPTPSSRRCSTRRSGPSSRSSCPTTRRSPRPARARTAAGGRTSRRTSARFSAARSQGRTRRGSAAAATSRSARRRCGRRSTQQRRRWLRLRAPTRRRGVPTRRAERIQFAPGILTTDDARLEQADVPAGDHVPNAPVGAPPGERTRGRLRSDGRPPAEAPHAGADVGAAVGAACPLGAGAPPPLARLRRGLRPRAGAPARGVPHGERGARLHVVGHGRVRVRRREPSLARRARARGLAGGVRGALAGDGARVRLRRRSARVRVGRGAPPGRPARGAGGKRRGDRLHRPLRDVDRRRLRSRAAARGVPRGRRALGGRCRLEPRRRSARDRRMGRRTSS